MTQEPHSPEVQQMLAALDPERIRETLARFPAAADIGLRVSAADHDYWWKSLLVSYKIPKDPRKRREKLLEALASLQVLLSRDIEHYRRLHRMGPAGLRAWDLDRCVVQRRDPLDEVACTLGLKNAHVSYHRTLIHTVMTELERMDA